MTHKQTIDILVILNAIAFGLNLFFLIIKIKHHAQSSQKKNKDKKQNHSKQRRYPSLNSEPESFKNKLKTNE